MDAAMSTLNTRTAAELAALLSSRICHDIAGPVSAMSAALSVLDDESASDMHDDAVTLLRTGVGRIRTRLDYMRMCFGASGVRVGEVSLAAIRALAEPMFEESRPDLRWADSSLTLSQPAARVLLNLIWIAVDSLPRGGDVSIEAAPGADGDVRLQVVAAGRRLRLDQACQRALCGECPEEGYDGRSIQPYYVGLIARESGGRVQVRLDEGHMELVALIGAD